MCFNQICAAVLSAFFATAATATPLDFTNPAIKKQDGLRLINTTGTVKIDKLGVWNIWPNYTGIRIAKVNLDGEPAVVSFTFSPADCSLAWLDGRMFSLENSAGKEIVRLDMVRRGRFRLDVAGQKAISRYQFWDCTVANWDMLTPKKVTLKIVGNTTALIIDGQTIIKVTGPAVAPGEYTAVLGKEQNGGRGALGWYSNFEVKKSDAEIPADQPLPGNQEWARRVDALDKFFVTPDMDAVPSDKDHVTYYHARNAAAYIALDGLWYRLNKKLTPGFEFFLTELEKLAAEAKAGKVADYRFDVTARNAAPAFFLAPNDTDFYYGDCGWGLASYAPEVARLGINLVSEHIWPNTVLDNNGQYQDVMLIRRTMPQLEEFEKYRIAFDLMIAPFTPVYVLRKHPEWDGVFVGLGVDNEAARLKQHATEWKGRQAGHGFLKASVIAPDYREMCKKFVEYLLPYLRQSKAIVSIDLANEVQFEDYSPLMQQRFREFLQKKYGTIEKVNAVWQTDYRTWEDILMVRPLVFDRKHAARFWDWMLCNREAGNEFFQYLHDLCRKNAPELPTHIKHLPHEFGLVDQQVSDDTRNFYDYADGIDRKNLANLTEIIGTDSWADNAHDRSGRLTSDVPLQSMYFALLRSWSPRKWIFDSEWHIIRCDAPATPPGCLDMVMQQNAVNGLRAGTFWLVCPGNGQEMELSSTAPLMLQSGLTTAKIRSRQDYYNAVANRSSDIALLYSTKARYLGGPEYVTALLRLFEAGLFSGVPLRFIDERQLLAGQTAGIKGIISINCPLTEPETPAAIRKFCAAGGVFTQIGNFANGNAAPASLTGMPNYRRVALTLDPAALDRIIMDTAKATGELPPLEVAGANGRHVFGVEWHVGWLADGRKVLYIANYSLTEQKLSITGAGRLTDVFTGKPIKTDLQLPVWSTFLGVTQ